jgi:glycerophosphoryl diester phosphodiesterase
MVLVIAHRGAAATAPENTIAAIKRGIADGADWLEIDVQETADGTVVVMHDRDFMRQAGAPLPVHAATAQDLAQLDIGAWFGPDFAGEQVATLDEALAVAPRC